MVETAGQSAGAKPQRIILKEGCWVKTGTGFRRMRERLETEATPIFSKGELIGFRFHSFLYAGFSRDLERIIVAEGGGEK
jgi:hypothetical protein